jgi:membrane associated rhomboid family serine protease
MFIPLKDENPTVNKPVVTVALIVINVLVFLFSWMRSARGFQMFIFQYGLIPYELVHLTELTPQFSAPVLMTPFTSMFLHGGLLHLGGNMLFLWIFGNNIEDYLGPVKFIIFYFVAGLAAVFLFVLFGPNSKVPLVGASGAIAGVLGAYLVMYPRARVLTPMWVFYFIRIVRLPASFKSVGEGGGVAWLAHVGGFAFGWLWFRLVAARKRRWGPRIYE